MSALETELQSRTNCNQQILVQLNLMIAVLESRVHTSDCECCIVDAWSKVQVCLMFEHVLQSLH